LGPTITDLYAPMPVNHEKPVMNFINQTHIAEALALAISLVFFNHIKKGKLKSLPFFLAFILLIELTGNYLAKVSKISNVWLYNISIPIEYSYYFYLFLVHGKNDLKKFIRYSYPLFLSIAIFYFFYSPLNAFHTNVLIAGQVFVIVCCCIYIFQLFVDSEEESLFKNYFYWLMSGLFLFNLGDVIYFTLYPVIHRKNWDQLDLLFKAINNNLLLLLYLSYTVSILIFTKYYRNVNA
jgi:hypothetical protein